MSTKIKRGKKPVKNVKKKVSSKDKKIKTPLNAERDIYLYEGKYYPVGDIIYIGFNPYFAKPRKIGKPKRKKGKLVHQLEARGYISHENSDEEETNLGADDEETTLGADEEGGTKESPEKNKSSKKKSAVADDDEEERAVDEDEFIIGNDKDETGLDDESDVSSESSSSSSEEEIVEIPFKPYTETGTQFTIKKVKVLNKEAIDIINQRGLPLLKETKQVVNKLVSVKYEQHDHW